MAKFTLIDNKTVISKITMHVNGYKRLRLAGVGGDKNKLQLNSTNPNVASGTIVALFDGPKGIWTVDFKVKDKGTAIIKAQLNNQVVAMVKVTVVDKIQLSAATTEAGLLERLFLAENRTPSQNGYDASQAKTGMQWMRLVLVNRLNHNPAQFMAPGATTIFDIVKAKGQFKGFGNYPKLAVGQETLIQNILKIANDDNDARQDKYIRLLSNAIEVAKSQQVVSEPCNSNNLWLAGWRTQGSSSPGKNFVKCQAPLSGNQFYGLKK